MKTLATAICLLLVSLHARADLLITQLVEKDGKTDTMTSKIKGNMIRTDLAAKMSSITDTGSGDVVMILHESKTYVKISAAQTKELMDKVQAMNPELAKAQTGERPKPVATGKKEKVNDYDTDIYTAQSPAMKFTYWVSKDFPNAAAVQLQMRKLQESMQTRIGNMNSIPDTTDLPGLPLKMEMVANGHTTTTTVVAVKEASVDDSDFLLPDGYKEQHIPGINAPAPAAPAALAPPAAPAAPSAPAPANP